MLVEQRESGLEAVVELDGFAGQAVGGLADLVTALFLLRSDGGVEQEPFGLLGEALLNQGPGLAELRAASWPDLCEVSGKLVGDHPRQRRLLRPGQPRQPLRGRHGGGIGGGDAVEVGGGAGGVTVPAALT